MINLAHLTRPAVANGHSRPNYSDFPRGGGIFWPGGPIDRARNHGGFVTKGLATFVTYPNRKGLYEIGGDKHRKRNRAMVLNEELAERYGRKRYTK